MPAVSVPCPRCRTPVPVPADAAGRPLSCPLCSAVVPSAGAAPDFSHLRNQDDPDEDILTAEGGTDGESVLEMPTVRPSKPTAPVGKPAPRPAAVYTPPAVATPPADPFAHLDDSAPQPAPAPRKPQPNPTPEPPTARLPKWVLPALLALSAYGVAATAAAVCGWVRPAAVSR